jgi:proton-coupled amino acid transporter
MMNTSKMWDMIAFSFYSFEGIGTLMPVMAETKNKHKFERTVKCALSFLALYFSAFGVLCYAYFGTQKEKFIINNMSQTNKGIEAVKLAYCINLVFSYPLTIFPANMILESFIWPANAVYR